MSRAAPDRLPAGVAPLGVFYACSYLGVGITLPYLPQHLRVLGLSGRELGVLLASYPLMSMLVPPLFGYLADRTRRGALLLAGVSLVGALAFLPLLGATDKRALVPWLLLAAFCNAPVSMLADSLTLERLGPRAQEYPRVRLWGSLGFVVAAAGFGFLWDGERASPPPVIVAALVALGLAFAASLRVRGRGAASFAVRLSDATALARDRRIVLLLGATCLHWLACSPYNLLFTVVLKDRGLAPSIAGLGLAAGVVAEVAVMALFPSFARRWSMKALLALAFLASSLRWALVGVTHAAAPMVLLQLLHGFTYAAFMVSSVTYLHQVAPSGLRATAQALFVSVTYGLGGVAGYLLAGPLFDLVSADWLFFGAAALEWLPALLVYFLPEASGRNAPPVLGSAEVPP